MTETGTPEMVMARAPKTEPGNPFARLRELLPEGRGLPQEEWRIRHRAVRLFIFGHAVALPIFGLVRGWSAGFAIGEGLLLAAIGLLAGSKQFSRKLRGALAALGCVLASAILVQFWGGVIEAHFHFFVVVALISLYQDWVPFGLAIVFTALDHGITGALVPEWVFNHDAAVAEPWRWAIIHAVFVLAECVALIAVWGANEKARAETDRVLRSTAEGLMGVDGEGKVTFANPAAIAMMGRTETDLLGRPLYSSLLGEDGRPVFAAPQDVSDGSAVSFQAILRRGDDKKLPVEILWTPVRGHGQGAVVALRDLTDRVRIEAERQVATQQRQELEHLREVDSFKTRFMNMAAHELNTPLTPIKVQMHLLKSKADTPELELHKRSIDLLDRNFKRLTGLVGDLLDSSRLQSDRMPVRPVRLDLTTVVNDVTESFRPQAKEAGIRLDVDVQGNLECSADADRITQAITNLLSNALKFTPSGGTVSVQAEALNGHIRVKVQDSGVGLTVEQAARLFKPFEQVHESQVRNKGGSGLGLYITRGIIELHGGRIWVESPGTGLGSAFLFEIPRQPPVRDAAADQPTRGQPAGMAAGAAA